MDLAWLEGKSESWTQIEEIVRKQANEINNLELGVEELMEDRDGLREQLNSVQGLVDELMDKVTTLMRANLGDAASMLTSKQRR